MPDSSNQLDEEPPKAGTLLRAALARAMFWAPLVVVATVCLISEYQRKSREQVLRAEGLWAAAQLGDLTRIESALAGGAEIDARDGMGNTALLIAACLNHAEIARLLVGRGADVNVSSSGYGTPLRGAVRHGQAALVDELLAAGADPNSPDERGRTPLVWCASTTSKRAPDVARALIRAGADVNRPAADGTTPLGAALANGNDRVAAILLRAGARASDWRAR